MSRQAKTITDDQLNELLARVVTESSTPLRDYAIILFSFKAGLRVGEIAKLDWRDVTDATGKIGIPDQQGNPTFVVPAQVAKKGHMRRIPMHPALLATLNHLKTHLFGKSKAVGPIIRGKTTRDITPNTLQRYLSRMYHGYGFDCTSHSGRRTMITKAIRKAGTYGCSIKDVQSIAGHKYIDTTERYIDLSDNVSSLVGAL